MQLRHLLRQHLAVGSLGGQLTQRIRQLAAHAVQLGGGALARRCQLAARLRCASARALQRCQLVLDVARLALRAPQLLHVLLALLLQLLLQAVQPRGSAPQRRLSGLQLHSNGCRLHVRQAVKTAVATVASELHVAVHQWNGQEHDRHTSAGWLC